MAARKGRGTPPRAGDGKAICYAGSAIQITPLTMARVKNFRHFLLSYNVAVTPISKTYVQRCILQVRLDVYCSLSIAIFFPGTRNGRARKQARQGATSC